MDLPTLVRGQSASVNTAGRIDDVALADITSRLRRHRRPVNSFDRVLAVGAVAPICRDRSAPRSKIARTFEDCRVRARATFEGSCNLRRVWRLGAWMFGRDNDHAFRGVGDPARALGARLPESDCAGRGSRDPAREPDRQVSSVSRCSLAYRSQAARRDADWAGVFRLSSAGRAWEAKPRPETTET
jgi:hypothetical protein